MSDQHIAGIADAVSALRRELQDAIDRGQREALRFRVAPVEIAMQVVVITSAEGRIGWGVLGVGAKGEKQSTHTLRLLLEPVLEVPSGTFQDVKISDMDDGTIEIGPRS